MVVQRTNKDLYGPMPTIRGLDYYWECHYDQILLKDVIVFKVWRVISSHLVEEANEVDDPFIMQMYLVVLS